MLKMEDYLGHMSQIEEPSSEVIENAQDLLSRVNVLLSRVAEIEPGVEAAQSPHINSGWRPASYNAKVFGSAKNSLHITGQAIDIADPDGELDEFLFDNPHLLVEAGLWAEHPSATRRWSHLQNQAPRSGNRFFFP